MPKRSWFLPSLVLYTTIVAAFSHVPAPRWGQVTPLASYANKRASTVIQQLSEPNLGNNFLANRRSLTQIERREFSTSGLSHLLAVSGGQLIFVLQPACILIFHALRGMARVRLIGPWAMPTASTLVTLIGFILAAGLSGLFGGGGALLRVAILTYLFQIPSLRLAAAPLARVDQGLSISTILRVEALLLLCTLHGNPFKDPSFLLSALGASAAAASEAILRQLEHRSDGGWSRIEKAIHSILLTTLFLTCILTPLAPIAPFRAAAANLIALPLVNFWITPLSLIVLLWPALPPEFLLRALDFGLRQLHVIAATFSDSARAQPIFPLASEMGCKYLVVWLVGLWMLRDAAAHKGLRAVREALGPGN